MNDIWNKLVDKLHSKKNNKEDKVKSLLSLVDIENHIGQDEVDKLIIKRRLDENFDDL